MNILKSNPWPVVWTLVLWLVGMPTTALGQKPHLKLSQPRVTEHGLMVNVSLQNLIDDDSLSALKSGVPATLVFRWNLREKRNGWPDSQVADGEVSNRVFFDVLEEKYYFFNHQGRPMGSCEALAGVEKKLCHQDGLWLGSVPHLDRGHRYYIIMDVSLTILGHDQVRDFEQWLQGFDVDSGEGGLVADDGSVGMPGMTTGLSGLFLGVVKRIAGFNDPTVQGRSPEFSPQQD